MLDNDCMKKLYLALDMNIYQIKVIDENNFLNDVIEESYSVSYNAFMLKIFR